MELPADLQVAQRVIQQAVWDTAAARVLQESKDTAGLRRLREPFAARLDSVRPYLAEGFASPDSSIRDSTEALALQGGVKLAQAGAYVEAYQWLDQLLNQLGPPPAAGLGPHGSMRIAASFWFGLSSALTLGPIYQNMVHGKHCDEAKTVNERIQRGLEAISLGSLVSPALASRMQGILVQYSAQMLNVKRAFKCTNF
jgi:hypothetical protein